MNTLRELHEVSKKKFCHYDPIQEVSTFQLDEIESNLIKIVSTKSGYQVCKEAERRHYENIYLKRYQKNGILISVKNTLIGYMKLNKEETFVAWRTLLDGNNNYKLIFGGIYSFPKKTRGKIIHAYANAISKGETPKINFEEPIEIRPERFLKRDKTFEIMNCQTLEQKISSEMFSHLLLLNEK